MADFPALPLFTDAIMADCQHLSDEEFGRYMRLLIVTWRTPGCSIPNDINWICKRLHIDPLYAKEKVQPLLDEFFKIGLDLRYNQKRLLKEYEYVRKLSEKGRYAAKCKKEKKKQANQTGVLVVTPTPTPTPHILFKENLIKEKTKNQKNLRDKKNAGHKLTNFATTENISFNELSGLPIEWVKYPKSNYQWDDKRITITARSFWGYWTSPDCPKPTKKDWFATWKNWIDNSELRTGSRVSNNSSKYDPNAALEAALSELALQFPEG